MQECNTTKQCCVKTAAPLATCTNEKQLSVIRFLSSEGVKSIKIHRQMKVQYGDACLSLQHVYEWTRKFMNGASSVTDSPRPGQTLVCLTRSRRVCGNGYADSLLG